ncbi:unnamed protein product [Fraxinus pennsylvanica]|uniref:Leucine zipper homeobox-associated domain-containing protein n=1 Tax=Fraxinus pennsylvanica TaxID=56036 RepID=A0AAD2E0J6_9LAMI|nr:unnamed protein product [Fraxinus pennsylvanica]
MAISAGISKRTFNFVYHYFNYGKWIPSMTKLKQTEVDCEYLRRCCENLTVENRRLTKEVNELRALKLSPQFYMNTSPPTTLTMCPQCERVAVSSTSSATRQCNPAAAHHQRPIPVTSLAAMIPSQPLDANSHNA